MEPWGEAVVAGVKGRSGGRNAKTVEELKAAGTYRDDRHGDISNPTVPDGEPVPPKALEGDAADEWARMVVSLRASSVLSTIDSHALYQYCRLFAETEQIAVSQEETAGSIDILEENLSGMTKEQLVQCFQEITKLRQLESRYTAQIQSGRMKLRAYLVEFGLTPAARSRVKTADSTKPKDAKHTSPIAQIQAQGRALRAVK